MENLELFSDMDEYTFGNEVIFTAAERRVGEVCKINYSISFDQNEGNVSTSATVWPYTEANHSHGS